MKSEEQKREELAAKWGVKAINGHQPLTRTELSPQAPAPHLAQVVAKRGEEVTAQALSAWNKRVNGEPIVDVAHQMGLSIAGAKALIKEAHDAIAEDLKETLNQNRELDLARTDQILKTFLPPAKDGSKDAALVVLKALSHRSRLTGVEPLVDKHDNTQRSTNVLVWIQQQLPAINRIVDALPPEI